MQGLDWVGKLLIVGGLVVMAVGGLLWLLVRLPGLRDLPGTLRIERPGFSCALPILASIVLSIVLTIVLNLVVRLFRR